MRLLDLFSLPEAADAWLRPLRRLKRRLLELDVELWALEGRELSSGEPLCIGYCGSEPTRNYLTTLAFASGASQRRIGKARFWSARRILLEAAPSCSLVVQESLEWLPPRGFKESLRLPDWPGMEIDLGAAGDGHKRSERWKQAEQRMRSNHLERSVSRDEESLRNFYFNMYLPHARARHGSDAAPYNYEEIRGDFFRFDSELLTLRRGFEAAACGILRYREGVARAVILGLRDASGRDFKEGVGEALYLAAMLRTRERGCRILEIGGCRPFLQDGVILYKRQWGAYFSLPAPLVRSLSLSLLSLSPGLEAFLARNPMIAYGGERHRLCAFFRELDAAALRKLEELLELYCSKGTLDLEALLLRPEAAPPPRVLEGRVRVRPFC